MWQQKKFLSFLIMCALFSAVLAASVVMPGSIDQQVLVNLSVGLAGGHAVYQIAQGMHDKAVAEK